MFHTHYWTRGLCILTAFALTLTVIGCGSASSGTGSGGSGSGGSERGGTLTIGTSSDTSTLDAAECDPLTICFPAYDGLIAVTAKGEYKPDLATSWKFTDSGHQTLRVSLRKGVFFTDGSELDAEAVAASIERFESVPGVHQEGAFLIAEVTPVDKYTVDIHYSQPVPYEYAQFQLTSQTAVGSIIGPKGLANPKSLETSSDGIGPYKLDAAETTKGSAYTYVPNSKYFNQAAIRYDKVVVKPMVEESARLSAIESGQIDWAHNIGARNVPAAEGAGLRISRNEIGQVMSLVLMDRSSGPLASQQVRQAISYAIPRDEITKALYGSEATPTSSLVSKGIEGYNSADTNMYSYDPAKAKRLLAEAGYPDGFTISVLDIGFFDPGSSLGQALKGALGRVGIKLELTASNALPGVIAEMVRSGKYDAQINGASNLSTFTLALREFGPGGSFNPLSAPGDSQLEGEVKEAVLEPTAAAQNSKMQDATKRLDELEWSVPIVSVPTLQATQSSVQNVPATFRLRELDPFSPNTSETWYSEGE